MTNKGIEIFEFQMEYKTLNIKVQKEDEKMFDYGMLYCYTKECEKGFKVKKVGKTTRKGTKFTYTKIKNDVDLEQYKVLINKMVTDFNEKYSLNLKIVNS